MRNRGIALIGTTILLAAIAGCGGDDDNGSSDATPSTTAATTASTTTAATPPASGTLTIGMKEFAFIPKDAVAKAGKVTITADNKGRTIHELVLLKTDADPAALPKSAAGKVDETSSVGEIADVEAGATKKHTFELKAGKYVIVCALPGHYEGGMYGTLTVK
jgi:uncharacterized cupredoxin-like copper-binding protein